MHGIWTIMQTRMALNLAHTSAIALQSVLTQSTPIQNYTRNHTPAQLLHRQEVWLVPHNQTLTIPLLTLTPT